MPAVARPRAILFDWDNTLVDSWATIHEALNHVMAAMGKPQWSLAETRARVRLSLREAFRCISASAGRRRGGSISSGSAQSISIG